MSDKQHHILKLNQRQQKQMENLFNDISSMECRKCGRMVGSEFYAVPRIQLSHLFSTDEIDIVIMCKSCGDDLNLFMEQPPAKELIERIEKKKIEYNRKADKYIKTLKNITKPEKEI